MKEELDPNKKTILVVDDEKPIIDILVYNLKKEGYNTLEATDGEMGINVALEARPDLILLDVMLPKVDGLTVCNRVKQVYNVPILMISARDEEVDKIVGLELGADDYITKPFSVRELMARVKANLRKNDDENNAKLLHELAMVLDDSKRTANFHTTLVVAAPGRDSLVVDADWKGYIGREPKGDNGFGYDPLFLVGNTGKTAAELSAEEKNEQSHRGQAVKKLMEVFPAWQNKQ